MKNKEETEIITHIIESPKYGTFKVLLNKIDYDDLVEGVKWKAHKDSKIENKFYITRSISAKSRTYMALHREIIKRMLNLQEQDLKGQHIDHLNGDPLDNRRDNLRVVPPSENAMNRGPQINNTSGYKGVHWDERDQKWRAQVGYKCKETKKRKRKFLGRYDDKEEAREAYDRWVIANCDEHAYTNFPREDYE